MLIYHAVEDLAELVVARIARQNQFLNKPSWTLASIVNTNWPPFGPGTNHSVGAPRRGAVTRAPNYNIRCSFRKKKWRINKALSIVFTARCFRGSRFVALHDERSVEPRSAAMTGHS